jgi:hypothetical protein
VGELKKLLKLLEKLEMYGDLERLETLMNRIIKALPPAQYSTLRINIENWKSFFPEKCDDSLQNQTIFYQKVKPAVLQSLRGIIRMETKINSDFKKRRGGNMGVIIIKEKKPSKKKYDPWRDD